MFKDDLKIEPIPAADFRIDTLQLDRVLSDVEKYVGRLQADLR